MKLLENSLVSIIIITYNSSKYILETLESAKAQTYQNIELIVSDDCSNDDTLEVCEKWLASNGSRFVRTKVITVTSNTGIPFNCNRGINTAKGSWVKIIAGDDKLINDCIQTNIDYSLKNSQVSFFFSQSIVFDSSTGETIGLKPHAEFRIPNDNINQFILLLKDDFVNSPTVFFNKDVMLKLGGYDQRYPYIEDYPMWFKLLKKGYVFFYIPIPTVMYRISGNSLSNTNGGISVKWLSSNYYFFKENIKLELANRRLYHTLFYKELDFFLKMKRINAKYKIISNFYRGINSLLYHLYKH